MGQIAVTPLYAGMLGFMLVVLSLLVSRQRLKHKVSTGDGGVPALCGAIRAHGNFVEFVPMALLLILLAELVGGPGLFLHLLGAGLVIGRILHAYGISTRPQGKSFGRMWGTLLTWLVVLTASGYLLGWVLGDRLAG